ncbi:MAG: hypothetical protein Udaeo2_05750 [Candidatus Udaeobacter sp.]|nr:MAG: hypothetical protein Udaeo2_05750 [Candidatus Udaeobacter sp.]
MVSGFNLTLMIGPVVPVPVSQDVLDALTSVSVTINSDSVSVFQLEFTLSNRSPLQTIFLLAGGASIPLVRVVIIVTVGGAAEVLMDGVMTNHEIRPGSDASHSVLTITGEDLSKVMDYFDFSGIPYPAMPNEARVALIVAKYAFLGIIPLVIPSVLIDIPIPTERIPEQKGKDLAYVKALADEVGYVFYIEPGPEPGMSIAYWGPEIKVGVPQKALSINMDAATNIESVSCSFNSQSRVIPYVLVQIPQTHVSIPIPIPDITPLNPPLGLISPIPLNFEPVENSAKYSPIRAAVIGLTKAARTSEAASASGSLNVVRYGAVLKARRLVGLRGVGEAFDGLYYVKSVTSKIKRGEFKQDFTLTRNGLLSTLPQVPV